jgi:hypothetical protein
VMYAYSHSPHVLSGVVHATLASADVDLCLVPEVAIELEGDQGCLPFLMERVEKRGHAVVVVAEGAGEELLGKNTETDAGGNRKLPAIGVHLFSDDCCSGRYDMCLFVDRISSRRRLSSTSPRWARRPLSST